MALFKTIASNAPITTAIKYINRERKQDKESVSYELKDGINCNPDTALAEMVFVKNQFNKKSGQQYIHNVLSFTKEETEFITPEQALQIMKELINEVPEFEGYQTTLAVHTDKEKLHVHAITNSVSADTGKKTRWNKFALKKLQRNLTVMIEKYNKEHQQQLVNALDGDGSKSYTKKLLNALDKDNSWVAKIIEKVMTIKNKAVSKNDFIKRLENSGIGCNWDNRKTISFFIIGEKKKIRNTKLQQYIKSCLGVDVNLEKGALENEFRKIEGYSRRREEYSRQNESDARNIRDAEQTNYKNAKSGQQENGTIREGSKRAGTAARAVQITVSNRSDQKTTKRTVRRRKEEDYCID